MKSWFSVSVISKFGFAARKMFSKYQSINSAANKDWSMVNYCQSLAFDCPYLSCNDHSDQWFFQEIFLSLFLFCRNSFERSWTCFLGIVKHSKQFQKQPLEVFCKKRCSERFCKICKCFPVHFATSLRTPFLQNTPGKHLCKSLFLNKVAGLSPATLLKKRLWHRCFPVNFATFLRTPFL